MAVIPVAAAVAEPVKSVILTALVMAVMVLQRLTAILMLAEAAAVVKVLVVDRAAVAAEAEAALEVETARLAGEILVVAVAVAHKLKMDQIAVVAVRA